MQDDSVRSAAAATPPMTRTQRRRLCHCLRVGVVSLLRPLRRQRMRVCSRACKSERLASCSNKAVLAVVRWVRALWSRRRSQASASCDSTVGSSGAYHLKSVWSRGRRGPLAHAGSVLSLSPLHRTWWCGIFSYKQHRLVRGPSSASASTCCA